MNRYHYINWIYDYFKKDWDKTTPEIEVKKNIEKWLMYEFHSFGGGGELVEWLDESGKTCLKRYTLKQAAEDRVFRHIFIHGVKYYEDDKYFRDWIGKKKSKKLLKLK